jgi:hypothetical protein
MEGLNIRVSKIKENLSHSEIVTTGTTGIFGFQNVDSNIY